MTLSPHEEIPDDTPGPGDAVPTLESRVTELEALVDLLIMTDQSLSDLPQEA